MKLQYIRKPEYDKRIERGDGYSSDAYLDTGSGKLKWVATGYDPNRAKVIEFCQRHTRQGNQIILVRLGRDYRLNVLHPESGEVLDRIELSPEQERALRRNKKW